jgi:hypothetical protein
MDIVAILRTFAEYIGLSTLNDYLLVGTAVVAGSILLLATVAYFDWQDFRYY